MPTLTRALARIGLATILLLGPAHLAAQGSAYIPLDDPELPLLEHLIQRGSVRDPSPMLRPFRRADAERVLAAADTAPASPSGALIHTLHQLYQEPDTAWRWSLSARAGAQGYTHARRDPLHPAGPGKVRPYAEARGEAVFGPLVFVGRPAVEPRLPDDPDWRGRTDLRATGRMLEAYLSAQFRWGRFYYGLMPRNWGPVGLPGIGVSDYGYPRAVAAFDIGSRDLRVQALATELTDQTDSAGAVIHRYFFAHRIGAHVSSRLDLGVWETTILAGPDRNFDGRFRNPASLLVLANQYGQGGGNVLVGLDARWRAARAVLLETQIGLDDIQYSNRSGPTRYPDRYALTLGASGPIGGTMAWRALYTRATSLAFRTLNPAENFTDAGVGLGRNFADDDELLVRFSIPLRDRWLVAPDAAVLRQGEGDINAPFPQTAQQAGQIPQIFIGTVEKTYRLGLSLNGAEGPLAIAGTAGFHHVVNADHVPGRTRDRMEAAVQITLGVGTSGALAAP